MQSSRPEYFSSGKMELKMPSITSAIMLSAPLERTLILTPEMHASPISRRSVFMCVCFSLICDYANARYIAKHYTTHTNELLVQVITLSIHLSRVAAVVPREPAEVVDLLFVHVQLPLGALLMLDASLFLAQRLYCKGRVHGSITRFCCHLLLLLLKVLLQRMHGDLRRVRERTAHSGVLLGVVPETHLALLVGAEPFAPALGHLHVAATLAVTHL